MKNQQGFTLIELVVVIVILGILAAVAVPKFVDMREEAAEASADGIYAAAQSAASLNHAAKLVGKTTTHITDGTTLLALFDTTPEGWVPTDKEVSAEIAGTTYTIEVISDETDADRAQLSKNW